MSRQLPQSAGEVLAEISSSRPAGEIFCNVITLESLGVSASDDIPSLIESWMTLRGLRDLSPGCTASHPTVRDAIRDIATRRRQDEYVSNTTATEKHAANAAKRFIALFAEPRHYAISWDHRATNRQHWAMCWDSDKCGIIVDRS